VGTAAARELVALNVRTVRHLALVEPEHLTMVFGRFGIVLHQRALGIDSRPVCPPAREPEIRRETVLAEDSNDPGLLRSALRKLVEDAGRELRTRGLTASRLGLKVRYADARTAAGSSRLVRPSDLEPELWRATDSLLERILTRRVRMRALRLRLSGLTRGPRQLCLFEDRPRAREAALTTALDRIRGRHGKDAVGFGMPGRPAA
jgi:DNA polymerase-4